MAKFIVINNIDNKKTNFYFLSDSSEIVIGENIYPNSRVILFWKTNFFPLYAETNGYWYPLFSQFNDNIFKNHEIILEIEDN